MDNSETDALRRGSVLADRYVTVKVIGCGGFGITYLAYDTETEKNTAVKEYYPRGVALRAPDGVTVEPIASWYRQDFTDGAKKFADESEMLSDLRGKTDVIKLYGSFSQNGTVYYTMEYIDGMTMREYTNKYGRISDGQALYTALEIAAAFGHIHGKRIIHRDIAPNNIMISSDGGVRLVDFGNARRFSVCGENSMTVSLKPGYAPLEQYRHHDEHGPWTDIYSLGAVLYYALTLKNPGDPMTRYEDDSEFQSSLSGTEPRLAAAICKMAAIRPADRYSCAEELLSALRAIKLKPKRFYL